MSRMVEYRGIRDVEHETELRAVAEAPDHLATVVIEVEHWGGTERIQCRVTMTPDEARKFGDLLRRVAAQANRLAKEMP